MRVGQGYPAQQATHLVEFYGANEIALINNVAWFLLGAVEDGGQGIVLATNGRLTGLRDALFGYRNVLFLDAREALAGFMVGGRPNRALFDATVGKLVRSRAPEGNLRAYGEMVGILWEAGMHDAAIELEELWNELLARTPFSLYCGYPLEAPDDRILAAHSECVGIDDPTSSLRF